MKKSHMLLRRAEAARIDPKKDCIIDVIDEILKLLKNLRSCKKAKKPQRQLTFSAVLVL